VSLFEGVGITLLARRLNESEEGAKLVSLLSVAKFMKGEGGGLAHMMNDYSPSSIDRCQL
jgi:hypothetical protein